MPVIITCNIHTCRNSQLASAVFPEFHGVSSLVVYTFHRMFSLSDALYVSNNTEKAF